MRVGVRYSQGPLCASSLSSRPACPTEPRQLPAWPRANRATCEFGTEGRWGSHVRALCCSHMLRRHSEEMQWQSLTSFFSFLKSWSAPDRPFRRPILRSYFLIAAIFLTLASRPSGKIKSSGTSGESRCLGRNIEPAPGPRDQDRYSHLIGSATQYRQVSSRIRLVAVLKVYPHALTGFSRVFLRQNVSRKAKIWAHGTGLKKGAVAHISLPKLLTADCRRI